MAAAVGLRAMNRISWRKRMLGITGLVGVGALAVAGCSSTSSTHREEIYTRPASPFVARFTGLSGEFPVRIRDTSMAAYVEVEPAGDAGREPAGPGRAARPVAGRSAPVTRAGRWPPAPACSSCARPGSRSARRTTPGTT
jgi:hypothetical protein